MPSSFAPFSRRRFLAGAAATFAGGLMGSARADDEGQATTRLNGWLESRWEAWLASSPMEQAYLGRKTAYDRWDDLGENHQADDAARARKDLDELRANFRSVALSPEARLSYLLYEYTSQQRLKAYAWRHHAYPVNQLEGRQQEIATFLINVHSVETQQHAEDYIHRLRGLGVFIDQLIDQMKAGEAAGVLAPQFVYGHVIRDCHNLIAGAPFENGKASPLWADITSKVDALGITAPVKQRLKNDAQSALLGTLRPSLVKLMAVCEDQRARATTDDGVWKLPKGDEYYAYRLADQTTTDMTAAEIHELGLAEVARIRGEMEAIKAKVKFQGTLQDFFGFLKTDPQFRYPQTDAGKAAYVTRAVELIDGMRARIPEVFLREPHTKLVVKVVEPFREQSATSAFYEPPGADDGRPGMYYVNTFDMAAQPKYEMESTAYHEAIPGHHMQIALAQEMDLPSFRRFADFTAYSEGWGLYSERLPKEMGFYQDPYSDFGRLSNELWRACRLVVDTGLHSGATKWTREKAIDYLRETTPNSMADIVNSVERYIVDPGQATAYTLGMLKMLELRESAKAQLKDKFDLRQYHDVVLGHAAVTLPLLERNVDAWVKETLA